MCKSCGNSVGFFRDHCLPTFPYKLDGHLLEYVTNMKDLGVTVSCQLEWTSQIEEITAKANRTLGLVKRICRDVHDVRTSGVVAGGGGGLWPTQRWF